MDQTAGTVMMIRILIASIVRMMIYILDIPTLMIMVDKECL